VEGWFFWKLLILPVLKFHSPILNFPNHSILSGTKTLRYLQKKFSVPFEFIQAMLNNEGESSAAEEQKFQKLFTVQRHKNKRISFLITAVSMALKRHYLQMLLNPFDTLCGARWRAYKGIRE
jgi:hypothetical protein